MFTNYKAQLELKNNELSSLAIRYDALETEMNEYKDKIEDFDNKVKQLTKTHTQELTRTKQLASVEIENLKLQLAKTEKSVNAKVNGALAKVGVSIFATEIINTSVVSDPEKIMEKFMTLSGTEKTEFYNANKNVITSFLFNNSNTTK